MKRKIPHSFVAVRPGRVLATSVVSLVLAACGGGDGADNRADTKPSAVIAAGAAPSGPGMALSFDGSGSRAGAGGRLSYQWQLSRRPTDSGASLDRSDADRVMFTPDLPGEYALTLVVTEDGRASEVATHIVQVPNPNPVVMVMGDTRRSVLQYAQVMLDAGQSLPPTGGDASQLRYRWRLLSEPEGSPATDLRDANSATPWFVANKLGLYQVELQVEYGDRRSERVTLDIIANAANSSPIAQLKHVVGEEDGRHLIKGVVGKPVALDASASHDVDGDPLQHRWYFPDPVYSLPRASTASITDANKAVASFVPDFPGRYEIEYAVNDGTVAPRPERILVQVEPDNGPQQAPVLQLRDRQRYDGKDAEIQCERGQQYCFITAFVNSNTGDEGIMMHAEIWNRRTPEMRSKVSKLAQWGRFDLEIDTSMVGVWEAEIYAEKNGMRSDTQTHTVNVRYGANQWPAVNARVVATNAIIQKPLQFVLKYGPQDTHDPNNDKLTYHWFLSDKPDGSQAQVIVTQAGEVASISPDVPGLYTMGVTAVDPYGAFHTRPRAATIMVKRRNSPPVIGSGIYSQGRRVTAEQPFIIGRGYRYEIPILDPDNDPLSIIRTRISPTGERGEPMAFAESLRTDGRLQFSTLITADETNFEYIVSDGIEATRKNISYSGINEDDYPTLLLDHIIQRPSSTEEIYSHSLFPYQSIHFQAEGYKYYEELYKNKNKEPIQKKQRYRIKAFDRDHTVNLQNNCPSNNYCFTISGIRDKQKIKKGESVYFEVQRPAFPEEFFSSEEFDLASPYNKKLINQKSLEIAAKYKNNVFIQFQEKEDYTIQFTTAVNLGSY